MVKYLPLLPGLVFLWLVWGTFQDLWLYWKLNTPIQAVVERVEVVQHSTSQFELKAYFQNRTCLLGKPYYLNRPSAERAAQALEGKTSTFWVDLERLDRSALERTLPFKKIFYCMLVLGILGYFYFLKFRLI